MSAKFIDQMVRATIVQKASPAEFFGEPIPPDAGVVGLEPNARAARLMGFAHQSRSELFNFYADKFGIPAGCVAEVLRSDRLTLESATRLWAQFGPRSRWLCTQNPQWRRIALINNLTEELPKELNARDRIHSILIGAKYQPELALTIALREYPNWKPTERDFVAKNWPHSGSQELLEAMKADRRAATRQLAIRNLAQREGTAENKALKRILLECFQVSTRWDSPADLSPFVLAPEEKVHPLIVSLASREELDALIPDFPLFARRAATISQQQAVIDVALRHPTAERLITILELPPTRLEIVVSKECWSMLPIEQQKAVFDHFGFNKSDSRVPDSNLISLWRAMAPWSAEVELAHLNHWASEVRRMRIDWLSALAPILAIGASTGGLTWLLEQMAISGLQAKNAQVRQFHQMVQLRIQLDAAYSNP